MMIDKSTAAEAVGGVKTAVDGAPQFYPKQAFPHQASALSPGMTLREWFAGHALAGLLANPSIEDLSQEQIASDAVLFADALLEQLTNTSLEQLTK
jgi:hypothetical protein